MTRMPPLPHETGVETNTRIRSATRELVDVRKELAGLEDQIDGGVAFAVIVFCAKIGCLLAAAFFKRRAVPQPTP